MRNELMSAMERIDADLIDDARRNAENGNTFHVAVAWLVLPSGRMSVAHCTMEHGDGTGFDEMTEFADECRNAGILMAGESVDVQLYRINLDEPSRAISLADISHVTAHRPTRS